MQQEEITIKLEWPNKSFGLDVAQIVNALSSYLRSYERRAKSYDYGSGRKVVIKRSRKVVGK